MLHIGCDRLAANSPARRPMCGSNSNSYFWTPDAHSAQAECWTAQLSFPVRHFLLFTFSFLCSFSRCHCLNAFCGTSQAYCVIWDKGPNSPQHGRVLNVYIWPLDPGWAPSPWKVHQNDNFRACLKVLFRFQKGHITKGLPSKFSNVTFYEF